MARSFFIVSAAALPASPSSPPSRASIKVSSPLSAFLGSVLSSDPRFACSFLIVSVELLEAFMKVSVTEFSEFANAAELCSASLGSNVFSFSKRSVPLRCIFPEAISPWTSLLVLLLSVPKNELSPLTLSTKSANGVLLPAL